MGDSPTPEAPRREELTSRQREVLELLAKGRTNFEIAESLGISLEGAKYHVREILGRLGVESREEAAAVWAAERRPLARLRRAFGWLVPRVAVAAASAALLAVAAVTVVVGAGIGGFGGKPAAAYVPRCAEGDVALQLKSEFHATSGTSDGSGRVAVRAELATRGEVECYLGGKLTVGPEPFDGQSGQMAPGTEVLDTILGSNRAAVTFPIQYWCDAYQGVELVARVAGARATVRLDHPAPSCEGGANRYCLDSSGLRVDCGPTQATVGGHESAGVGTKDYLPNCNPQRIRVGLDTAVSGPAVPPDASPEAVLAAQGTVFALTWSTPTRPLDFEFRSAATITVRDAAGVELPFDGNGENHSFQVRFRRATLAPGNDGQSRAQLIHVPDSGGRGDHSTETSMVTFAQGTHFLWRNWCGEDRSPVAVEVVTAAGRASATIERPPCVDGSRVDWPAWGFHSFE